MFDLTQFKPDAFICMLGGCVKRYTIELLYNLTYMTKKSSFDKCSTVIVRENFIFFKSQTMINSFQLLKSTVN